jgi:hypothetical protein
LVIKSSFLKRLASLAIAAVLFAPLALASLNQASLIVL